MKQEDTSYLNYVSEWLQTPLSERKQKKTAPKTRTQKQIGRIRATLKSHDSKARNASKHKTSQSMIEKPDKINIGRISYQSNWNKGLMVEVVLPIMRCF